MGMDGPGLAQGREESYSTFHTQLRGDSGFWSLPTGRWSVDEHFGRYCMHVYVCGSVSGCLK